MNWVAYLTIAGILFAVSIVLGVIGHASEQLRQYYRRKRNDDVRRLREQAYLSRRSNYKETHE